MLAGGERPDATEKISPSAPRIWHNTCYDEYDNEWSYSFHGTRTTDPVTGDAYLSIPGERVWDEEEGREMLALTPEPCIDYYTTPPAHPGFPAHFHFELPGGVAATAIDGSAGGSSKAQGPIGGVNLAISLLQDVGTHDVGVGIGGRMASLRGDGNAVGSGLLSAATVFGFGETAIAPRLSLGAKPFVSYASIKREDAEVDDKSLSLLGGGLGLFLALSLYDNRREAANWYHTSFYRLALNLDGSRLWKVGGEEDAHHADLLEGTLSFSFGM